MLFEFQWWECVCRGVVCVGRWGFWRGRGIVFTPFLYCGRGIYHDTDGFTEYDMSRRQFNDA